MDDKTVNTLEGFLYSSLKKGVSKSVLEQFLMDELDAAIETYETETAYAKQVDALGAALEPFYEYLHKYYEPLTKHITREEFEEKLKNFIECISLYGCKPYTMETLKEILANRVYK